MQILEREAIVQRALAPEPGLHTVPPSVIRAREAHDQLAPGVEPRQPRGGHDGFGAAHVKRHLVEPRDGLEARDVLRDDRMEWTEHEPEVLGALEAARHPLLVARRAGHVDPVRAAHVERPVPVEMLQPRAVGRGDDGREVEMLLHEPGKRKRHPIRVGEAQIGKALSQPLAPGGRLGIPSAEEGGQPLDPLPPARDQALAGAVSLEELSV